MGLNYQSTCSSREQSPGAYNLQTDLYTHNLGTYFYHIVSCIFFLTLKCARPQYGLQIAHNRVNLRHPVADKCFISGTYLADPIQDCGGVTSEDYLLYLCGHFVHQCFS